MNQKKLMGLANSVSMWNESSASRPGPFSNEAILRPFLPFPSPGLDSSLKARQTSKDPLPYPYLVVGSREENFQSRGGNIERAAPGARPPIGSVWLRQGGTFEPDFELRV